jgi:DNA-binding transcriptional MerR regulator
VITLAELAAASDVTERTIRYYVHAGLLPAPGSAAHPLSTAGTRGTEDGFSDDDLERLAKIERLRAQGRRLWEIRELLEGEDRGLPIEDSPAKANVWLQIPVTKGVHLLVNEDEAKVSRKAAFSVAQKLAAMLSEEGVVATPGGTAERRSQAFAEASHPLSGGSVDSSDDAFKPVPDQTVMFLNALERLGLTDEIFGLVHHMAKQTIDQHRQYCAPPRGRFHPDSPNATVCKRLRAIWLERESVRALKDAASRKDRLRQLAQQAVVRFPFRSGGQ